MTEWHQKWKHFCWYIHHTQQRFSCYIVIMICSVALKCNRNISWMWLHVVRGNKSARNRLTYCIFSLRSFMLTCLLRRSIHNARLSTRYSVSYRLPLYRVRIDSSTHALLYSLHTCAICFLWIMLVRRRYFVHPLLAW